MSITRYVGIRECSTCGKPLTNKDTYRSGGVCPYCGTISGDTIVNYVTRAVPVEVKEETKFPSNSLVIGFLVLMFIAVQYVVYCLVR